MPFIDGTFADDTKPNLDIDPDMPGGFWDDEYPGGEGVWFQQFRFPPPGHPADAPTAPLDWGDRMILGAVVVGDFCRFIWRPKQVR